MALILCLETATEICSVALAVDGEVIAAQEEKEGNVHAAQITLLIDSVLKKAEKQLHMLDAVAVSKGPGSYTGLRVGVSTAKGLCYALGIPLLAVHTLESLTYQVIRDMPSTNPPALFVPMLDARRMEVYCAVFDEKLNARYPTSAEIIDETFFTRVLTDLYEPRVIPTICFFGNGAAKCRPVITQEGVIFLDDIRCSAASMSNLAYRQLENGRIEDVAYFEPFYLKEFVGTKPRKR
jgi:tRNA threonylcarbamoyladenosine biosynthesis protein TsaB